MVETISSGNGGLLVVVSAPSGAGKTSVLHTLMDDHPEIGFSVSVTTRSPRPGEEDGVNYHFLSDDEFERLVEQDEFAEWAEVHGCRYGTLKRTIKETLESGRILMLDTDTVGAFNIRKSFPSAVLVFIVPPSPDVLRERLVSRRTETEDSVRRRLDAAPAEVARMKDYDYIVLNDTIDRAAGKIVSIIRAELAKSERVVSTLTAWR